jgi:hypothetical protein
MNVLIHKWTIVKIQTSFPFVRSWAFLVRVEGPEASTEIRPPDL